jgi:hypothetical protein
MKVEKEPKMKASFSPLVQEFVDLSYRVYGSYAHSSGYMQSTLSNIMDGYATVESTERMLKQAIAEMEDRLMAEEQQKQFEMMSHEELV